MRRADRPFVTRLFVLSVVIVGAVGLWTRGDSRVLEIEARMASVRALAAKADVPVPALVTALVGEAYREGTPRADAELASELAAHLRASGGDVPSALGSFATNPAEERRLVDLWRRMRSRWH